MKKIFSFAFNFAFVCLVSLVGLGDSVLAQRTDTIYQTIRTNADSSFNNSFVTVRNIGQNLHTIAISFSNNGGNTCRTSSGNGGAQVKVSWDGFFFFDPLHGVENNIPYAYDTFGAYAASFSFKGAFPFVMLTTLNGDDTNCRMNMWYSGNISGNLSDPSTFNSTQDSTSIIAGYYGNAVIGNNTLIAAHATNDCRFVVYEMIVSNQTAGQTLLFTAGATPWLNLYNLQAGQTFVLPNSGRAHFTMPSNQNLVMNASAGTGVTVSLRGACERN